MRSLAEKRSARRLERSLRQLERLSSISTAPEPQANDRMKAVYTSGLPSVWKIKVRIG